MKCSYCGAELSEGQKFCIFCGTKLEQQAETAAPQNPVYEPIFRDDISDWEAEKEFPAVSVTVPATAEAEVPTSRKIPGNRIVPAAEAPRLQLPTGRGLGKMFFLGILTLGIYPTVIWSRIVTELNLAASRYDGKRTMPYFAMCTLAPVTLGIYLLVWMHQFCGRIGEELNRRGIDYEFGSGTFWLWNVLGSLILVGPFVFLNKLMKSMNRINEDLNIRG